MGPEDKSGELEVYTLDGERVQTGPLPEITLSDAAVAAGEAITRVMSAAMAGFSVTVRVKPPKQWNCKSRKRFIKLLMSKGISRNQAGSVARVARIAGVPYGELWRNYFFWG